MLEFSTDLEAAKHFVSMGNVVDVPNSTRKFTLTLELGDIHVGNRGVESVLGIGDALAQLRNEAGLTPGQMPITRVSDCVTIETTAANWTALKAHVQGAEREKGRY